MHNENKYDSRNAFLKKISLAFISVLGPGIIGFNLQKHKKVEEKQLASISNDEANDIIRNMHSPKVKQLEPEPPPKTYSNTMDKLLTEI